jgi:hypothetical protein
MIRSELVRMLVLDVVANDYEEVEKIETDVRELAMGCGIALQSIEVLAALRDLVEAGLVKAYRFLPGAQKYEEIHGLPPENEFRDCWFWITSKGKLQIEASDGLWPFDEDGIIRKGWSLTGG